jgi:hypothetical protein
MPPESISPFPAVDATLDVPMLDVGAKLESIEVAVSPPELAAPVPTPPEALWYISEITALLRSLLLLAKLPYTSITGLSATNPAASKFLAAVSALEPAFDTLDERELPKLDAVLPNEEREVLADWLAAPKDEVMLSLEMGDAAKEELTLLVTPDNEVVIGDAI